MPFSCVPTSAINKPSDLAGKMIAAGLINSINHVHMVHWLRGKGVDPTSVRFVELPFPQMADALYQKRVDAVWNVEPFMTIMVKSGNARIVVHPYQENNPNMDVTGFYARDNWLKSNPDVAAALQARHGQGNTLYQRRFKGGARRLGCEIYRRQGRPGCADGVAAFRHRVQCAGAAQKISTLRWRKKS